MNRRSFALAMSGTLAVAATPFAAFAASLVGRLTTQHALFAALPRPRRGAWLRLVMGSGVAYQKQIGLGSEAGDAGDLLYVETQIGLPGGSCNPNTLKKTYLRAARYSGLMTEYAVAANVARSGNTLTRWGDVAAGQTATRGDEYLRLLDAHYLYDSRPCVVESVAPATLHVAGATHETTHVAASFRSPSGDARLEHIELWHTTGVPFGVARYRAKLRGIDSFELTLESYGHAFKSDISASLATIRAMTPNGMSVENG